MPFPHALPTPHPLTCHTTLPPASCSSASATPFPSPSQPTQPHVLSPPLMSYLHPSPPHLTQSLFNLIGLPDSWPVFFSEGLSYISSNQIQESALGSHVNSIPVHHLCGSNTAREGKCEVAVLIHGALGLPMKSDGRVPQSYIVGWVVETTEWLVKEQ